MPNIAGLTIVSKNYISAARVLCDSFLKHHPNARFFVLLVDKLYDEFDPKKESFELLKLDRIGLPASDSFPYQYSILELNTAVKPFALKHLFKTYSDIEYLTYIDPDIMIFKKLDKVWESLAENSVVLTPHMREPMADDKAPSEVQILQSGTYNLGFIGLKNNSTSLKLLGWWMEKLYLDCVVDIPNGLFVDQKWMDLVPAYYEDVFILRDPTYNVAYWNLHEREVVENKGNFLVEGEPLSFFHFSGYNPSKKNIISKHQTRHSFEEFPVLKKLFDIYADKLIKADFFRTKEYEYAYNILPNGIETARPFQCIIRHCLKNKIKYPSPEKNPDEFCKFLLKPNPMLYGYNLPPIFHGILQKREDVKKYFPDAWYRYDKGFMEWLYNTGKKEEKIVKLIEKFDRYMTFEEPLEMAFDIYNRRADLQKAYPNIMINSADFIAFCEWLNTYGVKEEKVPPELSNKLLNCKYAFVKIISIYLTRRDLQKAYPSLAKDLKEFTNWLLKNFRHLPNVSKSEVFVFRCLVNSNLALINHLQMQLSPYLWDMCGVLTYFNKNTFIDKIKGFLPETDAKLINSLAISEQYMAPLEQLEHYYAHNTKLLNMFPDAFSDAKILNKLCQYVLNECLEKIQSQEEKEWLEKLTDEIENFYPDNFGINVAGYFNAATGMGQSSRSIVATIKAANLKHSTRTLPNLYISPENGYNLNLVEEFTKFSSTNRINLIVSNADAIKNSLEFHPYTLQLGRYNIGYWVWETEQLPKKFAKAADGLTEIWTPSHFSAKAIQSCVDIPVKVLPHIIDFEEIDSIMEQPVERAAFGLPQDALLFGFFFDQKSVLERKNPRGLIESFKKVFYRNNNAFLVLKVNSDCHGIFEYETIKAENRESNIIWIENTLTREQTLKLLNCLDVYISLHRSEGFGLTIAEAMALRKPTVVSNYSGNMDFIDSQSSLLVKCDRIKTKRAYGAYPKGTIWGDPSLADAVRAISTLQDKKTRKKIGSAARRKVYNELNPKCVGKKLMGLLESIAIPN